MRTTIATLLDLDGQSAIVTGGAMGIGLGIARRLAEAGASVLIGDIDEATGIAAAKTLSDEGLKVESTLLDVSDEPSVAAAVDMAVRHFGGLDILVNNAGIYPNVSLADLTMETYDRVMAINLRGAVLCTKAASTVMRAQGRGGRIVMVTSIDALHPSMVGLATYDATKHGLWGFTKNAALELAPFGIQVNAVAPGGIATPGTGMAVEPSEAGVVAASDEVAAVDMEAAMAQFLARIPMGRLGEPDDIGKVVLMLASPLASYMTGAQIVVDGGALLR